MKVDQYTRQVVPESSRALSAAEATVAPVEMAGNINYAGTMAEMGRSADGLGAAVIGLMEKRQEEKDKLALTNFSGEAEAAYIDFVPSMDEKKDAENLQLRRAKLENYLAKDQTMSGEMRKLLQARIMAQDRIQQTKATARRNIMIRDQNVSNAHQTMKLAMQNGEVDKAEKVRNILLSDYPEQAARLNLPDDDELQDVAMYNNLSIAATQKDAAGLRQSSEYLTNLLKQPGDSFEFDYDGRAVKVKRQSLYKLRNLYRSLEQDNSAETFSRLNDEFAAGKLTVPDLKKLRDSGQIDATNSQNFTRRIYEENSKAITAKFKEKIVAGMTADDELEMLESVEGALQLEQISEESAADLRLAVKNRSVARLEQAQRTAAAAKKSAVSALTYKIITYPFSHNANVCEDEKRQLMQQIVRQFPGDGDTAKKLQSEIDEAAGAWQKKSSYKNLPVYHYAQNLIREKFNQKALFGLKPGKLWGTNSDTDSAKQVKELLVCDIDQYIKNNPTLSPELVKKEIDRRTLEYNTTMVDQLATQSLRYSYGVNRGSSPMVDNRIQPGFSDGGWVFSGGDPKNKKNWQKIDSEEK